MLDKVQVIGPMKNYLLSIDNELKDCFGKLTSKSKNDNFNFEEVVQEFVDDTVALLDYWAMPMFQSGKLIIAKQIGKAITKEELNENEERFIKNYKNNSLSRFGETLYNGIINCFEQRKNDKDFYDDIIEVIADNAIKFFKSSQLFECKANDIQEVNLISDHNSCSRCQTASQFVNNVDKLLENIDDIHSFCKLSIDLNNPELKKKSIITHLNMIIPELVTEYEFKFVDNINDEPEFINLLSRKYDSIKTAELHEKIGNQLMSLKTPSKVLISKKHASKINYIITSTLLKDKLLQKDYSWWKENYYKKQETKWSGDNVVVYTNPFVNYLAEQDPESHFIQSAITYVLEPQYLKNIDNENYQKLKTTIFNNTEFLRG